MMGLALQGQGQLDAAFDRFRRVPMGDAVMGNLYSLALDFERKRQFNKAEAVYQHMATYDKDYKDLQAKLNRAKNLSETVMLGGGGLTPGRHHAARRWRCREADAGSLPGRQGTGQGRHGCGVPGQGSRRSAVSWRSRPWP
jgi:hypothetical protein